ncbi:hypothetical protein BH09PSE1_BH09PSE1_20200 [soil metagenome]
MPSFPLSLPRLSSLLLLLLVVLATAVPAAVAHACSDAGCDTVQLVVETAAADDDDGPCSDCGQACANGCCHGSHAATTVEPPVIPLIVTFDQPASWRHATTPPLADPSGPRRPPRR